MIKLADKKDIPLGKSRLVTLADGQEIALFNIDGQIYALENACPHLGGPLNEGDIEQHSVICPLHGWQFDIKTGLCENIPGEEAKTYPLIVSDEGIFLDEKTSD